MPRPWLDSLQEASSPSLSRAPHCSGRSPQLLAFPKAGLAAPGRGLPQALNPNPHRLLLDPPCVTPLFRWAP